MLKKTIIISNTPNSDVKYLNSYTEEKLINGLNAVLINNAKEAKEIAKLLYKHQLFDLFIFARNKAFLNTIYKVYPYSRLIYVPDTFTHLIELSKTTLSNHSNTVCLKASLINQEMVRTLKSYGITVFAEVTNTLEGYQALLSGVDGLFGINITKKDYDIKGDFAFIPFIIAHRGYHKEAQENSLKSASFAKDIKADFVELDFHLTKDKQIVVNHDDTLGRTYEKDYVIKKDTLKSLQSIKMTFNGDKTDEVIPTVKDFHEVLKDSNTSLLMEAKTSSVVAMKQLNKQLNDWDQPPLLMSFYPFALVNFKTYLASYARGFLIDLDANHMSVSDVIKISNKYNLTIHPYFNHHKTNLVEILKKRAISYCPWGIKNDYDLVQQFKAGYYGINTDESARFTDFVKNIKVERHISYTIGETKKIQSDSTKKMQGEIHVISNTLDLIINGDEIVNAAKEGIAYIYLTYDVQTELLNYTLFSDLIQVEVTKS